MKDAQEPLAEGDGLELIPKPRLVEPGAGHFELRPDTVIEADRGLRDEARRLQETLANSTGYYLDIVAPSIGTPSIVAPSIGTPDTGTSLGARPPQNAITLAVDEQLGAEDYRLEVTENAVQIVGGSGAGVGFGVSTLLRMFPPEVFRVAPVADVAWRAPCVTIEDGPTYEWRALMVDVARHFMPKRELFRIIDLMALLQFNVLHLHLTDDQGWRVQIHGYPRLEEVAVWRTESQIGPSWTKEYDGRPHGGFYTQDDLKEIVGYAATRNVSVMPEVDLPGHMEAAIAAYPQFGTSREETAVRTKWGISENVLNLDPDTVQFVRDVVEQVADIFPFKFFSIGGDECPTIGWENDPKTQERKQQLGIETDRGIQAWYTKMVADLMRERGKRIVAWDEVLEDEVDEDVVIQSWRGMRGAEIALARGLDVISCPTHHCYFDYRQSESPEEPVPVGVPVTLEQVYSFNPTPGGEPLVPRTGKVLGGQGNLWSEFMNTGRSVDFAAFPRAAALAEVLWSGAGGNYEDFLTRLPALLERFDVLGVDYRPLDGPLPWQKRPGVPGRPGSHLEHQIWLLRETKNLKVEPENTEGGRD